MVGQQPFGGGRASGTNQKAGSAALLANFVLMRCVKEEFCGGGGNCKYGAGAGAGDGGGNVEDEDDGDWDWGVEYPSNLA